MLAKDFQGVKDPVKTGRALLISLHNVGGVTIEILEEHRKDVIGVVADFGLEEFRKLAKCVESSVANCEKKV